MILKRGHRVAILTNVSDYEKDFEGIIEYCSGDGYCRLIVLGQDGKPINVTAKYKSHQLMLVDDNIQAGENIIAWWENRKDK